MVTVDVFFFFNIRAGFMFRYNPSGSSHHFLHVRTACGLSSNGKTNDATGPNFLDVFPQQCSSKCPKHMPRISIFPPFSTPEVRDMVSSLRLDVDARRRKVDEILATVRGAVERWKSSGMGGLNHETPGEWESMGEQNIWWFFNVFHRMFR